jgi:Holliday junction resolvase-like predicted endonuclease
VLFRSYGHPFEAVTRAKQRVIRKLAAVYLAEQDIQDQFVRFDVVGISYPEGEDPLIELLKDAF